MVSAQLLAILQPDGSLIVMIFVCRRQSVRRIRRHDQTNPTRLNQRAVSLGAKFSSGLMLGWRHGSPLARSGGVPAPLRRRHPERSKPIILTWECQVARVPSNTNLSAGSRLAGEGKQDVEQSDDGLPDRWKQPFIRMLWMLRLGTQCRARSRSW